MLTTAAALVAPLLVLAIVLVLAVQSAPAVTRFGPGFLFGTSWNPVTLEFGALPFIVGTLASSAIALALAVPVGVAVALVLAEPGARGLRGAVGTGVELLAAIPSVVYGVWALYVMAPFVYLHVEVPVVQRLGWIGALSGPPRQTSLFTASLVLAIMVLPTLGAISRDVVRAVPKGLRESAVALGATWWETNWKVILPAARGGIFGAGVLALGRALGETIAVTMVIGNRPDVPASIFAPAYTLASVIANEFTEATGPVYPAALLELGLVLILVTFAINLLALLLVRRSVEPAR
ncbi:MAG: phosphate ABC transporter permease subunit PstC [Chloroflexi bacterium]|nr:MAG: phosphate ABC transporter permease subunit PstC [Chloroflexota bacterium]TMF99622.1 MAG: phosphate ABC transporter permease subunit PstC [Chloroflexota bacterium]